MTDRHIKRSEGSNRQGSEDQGALSVALVQLPLLITVVLLAAAVTITPGGSRAAGDSGDQPSVQYLLLTLEIYYLYSEHLTHDVKHEIEITRSGTTVDSVFTWSEGSLPSRGSRSLKDAWPGGSIQVTSQVEDLGEAEVTWPDGWKSGSRRYGTPHVLRIRYFARMDYLTYRPGARVTFHMGEMSGRSPCPEMKDRESPSSGGKEEIRGNTYMASLGVYKTIKAMPHDVATVLQTGPGQRGTGPIEVLGFGTGAHAHESRGKTCIVSDAQGIRYARLFYPYGFAARVHVQSSSSLGSHKGRFEIRAPAEGPVSLSFDFADAPSAMLETATQDSTLIPMSEVRP